MRLNIFAKLFLGSLLIALVPMAVISLISYRSAKLELEKEIYNNLITISDYKTLVLQQFFTEREMDVETLANRPNVINNVESLCQAYKKGMDSSEYLKWKQFFIDQLEFKLKKSGFYNFLIICNDSPQGEVVFSLTEESDLGTNLLTGIYKNTNLAKSFRNIQTTMAPDITSFQYYPPSHESAAFVVAPIFKEGGIVAVLVAQLDNTEVFSILNDYTGLQKTGETVVWYRSGNRMQCAAPTRFDPDAEKRRIVLGSKESLPGQRAVVGEKGFGLDRDYLGHETLAVWRYLPWLEWGMVVKIDAKEVFQPIYVLRNWTFVIGFGFGLIIFFLSYFISRRLSQPIACLKEKAALIGSGQFDYKKEGDCKFRNDELGDLSISFQQMADNLKNTTASKSVLEQEIEQRKKVERNLEESKKRYQTIYQDSTDAIMLLDPEDGYLGGNPATIKLFKCKDEEDFKKYSPHQLSPEKQPDGMSSKEKAKQRIDQAMKEGSLAFEWKHKTLEGNEFDSAVLLSKIHLDGKELLLVTVRDISMQKLAEEALKQAMQMKTNFLSTVSHELRTPLSIITESVSLVLDKIPGEINQEQTQILDTAIRNLKRLGNLINDLLDISKIEAGKVELHKTKINIVNLLQEIRKNWESVAKEKNLKINSDLPSNPIELEIDSDRIVQVINNIFSNAIKFTDSGGQITLQVADQEKRVEVSISDTGRGISKEDLPKVFGKFMQFGREAGPGQKGTGLGLSICKELVKLHGGEISVESESGKGSKFTFWLPKQ